MLADGDTTKDACSSPDIHVPPDRRYATLARSNRHLLENQAVWPYRRVRVNHDTVRMRISSPPSMREPNGISAPVTTDQNRCQSMFHIRPIRVLALE